MFLKALEDHKLSHCQVEMKFYFQLSRLPCFPKLSLIRLWLFSHVKQKSFHVNSIMLLASGEKKFIKLFFFAANNRQCQTHSCSIMYTMFLLARACRRVQAWNISETWAKLFYRLKSERKKGKRIVFKLIYSRSFIRVHFEYTLTLPRASYESTTSVIDFNNENPFKNDITCMN